MLQLTVPSSDRVYRLEGSPEDLSVVGGIRANGGIWEPHITAVMQRYIRPDSVCLDIGANIGVFTLIMSGLASNGHVYSFEPSSKNMAFLRQNLVANHVANVTPVQIALWDQKCEMEFFYIDELAGCAFIEVESNREAFDRIASVVTQPWMKKDNLHCRHELVPCERLDAFVADTGLSRLDWIKLDAEGAEAAVLNGAQETLARFRPQIIAEFNPACMIHYFARQPRQYFELLASTHPLISIIEANGALSHVPDYSFLEERIENGKGWEDLFCQPASSSAA